VERLLASQEGFFCMQLVLLIQSKVVSEVHELEFVANAPKILSEQNTDF
jgi:hypothetical protein